MKVTEDDPLQGISLKSEIEAVVKEGRKCKNDGTDEDFDTFLSVNVGICIAGRNVGPHLTKNQIFRHHLLNPDQLQKSTPPSELTHGMIIDVMLFLKKEYATVQMSNNTWISWSQCKDAVGPTADFQVEQDVNSVQVPQQEHPSTKWTDEYELFSFRHS